MRRVQAKVRTAGDTVEIIKDRPDLGPDVEEVSSMGPDAAEEMAHALLICAHAARGYGITEADLALVRRFTLTRGH